LFHELDGNAPDGHKQPFPAPISAFSFQLSAFSFQLSALLLQLSSLRSGVFAAY
jgi:hypothetical protein